MPSPSLLVIGCGSIGERHLRCFQRTGRARVTACESHPELAGRIGATYGVEVLADWQTALARGFDGVVICTPAPAHVPLATAALRAGAHVLVEKPLSHSLEGLDELFAARAAARRAVAVAYVLHVYPVLAAARDFLARGEFGPVRQATATAGQCFPRFRPAYASTYYRDRATGGGAIQDALTHTVNWVESVLGPADSVLCDCAHLVLPDVTVEDTVHVASRHGDALASFSLNQFQAPNELACQFNAAGGSVRVELPAGRWGTCAQGEAGWQWRQLPALDRDGPFLLQAEAFLDLMAGAPSRLCSLEAGAQTLRFNLAALTAAARGVRVRVRGD